jgi:hypothetical protein
MSEKWQLPKNLPKQQRRHLKQVLKTHPNVQLLCNERQFDKAVALLLEDNYLVAGNCLLKSSQPEQV